MHIQDYITQVGFLAGHLIFVAIIFAESGIFIGFFLPGDSLLFSAGILAARGNLHIGLLLILGSLAAILGDNVGYAFGKRFGHQLFQRPNSRFFKQENLLKAKAFYELHGKKTIVLARFTPIVRTFAPIVAGASDMDYPTFLLYNVIGGVSWIFSVSLLGYFLGNLIPSSSIEAVSISIIVAIIIISLLPVIKEVRTKKKKVT